MGRPKKVALVSTKSHDTGASKETKKSQAKGGVSKKKAKISSAQKNNVSATASKEPQLDEVRAKKLKNISIGQILAEYCPPADEESARIRMANALFLYEWNLLSYYEDGKSSNKVCSNPILRCTNVHCYRTLLTI
jgi:hypothetical protein